MLLILCFALACAIQGAASQAWHDGRAGLREAGQRARAAGTARAQRIRESGGKPSRYALATGTGIARGTRYAVAGGKGLGRATAGLSRSVAAGWRIGWDRGTERGRERVARAVEKRESRRLERQGICGDCRHEYLAGAVRDCECGNERCPCTAASRRPVPRDGQDGDGGTAPASTAAGTAAGGNGNGTDPGTGTAPDTGTAPGTAPVPVPVPATAAGTAPAAVPHPDIATSPDGQYRTLHDPFGSGAQWDTGSDWDREIVGNGAKPATNGSPVAVLDRAEREIGAHTTTAAEASPFEGLRSHDGSPLPPSLDGEDRPAYTTRLFHDGWAMTGDHDNPGGLVLTRPDAIPEKWDGNRSHISFRSDNDPAQVTEEDALALTTGQGRTGQDNNNPDGAAVTRGGDPMTVITGEATNIEQARAGLSSFTASATTYLDTAQEAQAQAAAARMEAQERAAAAEQMRASMAGKQVDTATLGEVARIQEQANALAAAAEEMERAAGSLMNAADGLSASSRAALEGLNARHSGLEEAHRSAPEGGATKDFYV